MIRLLTLLLLIALFSAGAAVAARDDLAKADRFILKRDYRHAADATERAARAGDSTAQYRMGMIYRLGLGRTKDDTKVRYWLEAAARGGSHEAATLLARLVPNPKPTRLGAPPWKADPRSLNSPVDLDQIDKAGNSWLARAAARGRLGDVLDFATPAQISGSASTPMNSPLLAALEMNQTAAAAALIAKGPAAAKPAGMAARP